MRRLRTGALCFSMVALLTGCHHKLLPAKLPPPVLTPDVPPPAPDSPPMESPPPAVSSTTPPVKVTQTKPKRAPKKGSGKASASDTAAGPAATAPPTPAPAPPPSETAAAAATPTASPIGELSTGDDANPQKQQDALDLITSSERRLQEFAKTATQQQHTQLRKVSYFLRQARQALGTGDVEGAKTLATKAKVLLDDLSK